MLIPAVLMLGGAGVIAYQALAKKDDAKPSGTAPGAKPGAPTAPGMLPTIPGAGTTPAPEPGKPLPPEYLAALNVLLSSPTGDPTAFEALATQLASMGFVAEANALRAKAAELRAKPAPTAPTAPSAPQVMPTAPSAPQPTAPPIPVPPPPGTIAQIALPTGSPLLRRGSTGSEVLKWQGFLRYVGRSEVAADGQFGPMTETATKWFQGSRKISADGIVGPMTVAEAKKVLAAQTTTSGILISGAGALGPRQVQCLAPNGCWLRQTPSASAKKLGFFPANATASLITYAKGQKANAGAPGPGGWAQITHGGIRGWVPAEWLKLGA